MGTLNYDMISVRSSPSGAGLAATDDEFRTFAEKMERLVHHTNDPFVHYRVGIGRLSIGDEGKYIRHCRILLDSFENAFRPEIASRLAKVSLLRPDLQSASDLDLFYKLSEFASGFESSPLRHWFFLTRAIAEQRRGDPNAALHWTERSRGGEHADGYMVAGSHAVDALARLDLGEIDAARESLKRGREFRDSTRERSFKDGHDVGWVDWRVFRILEAEIEDRLRAAA